MKLQTALFSSVIILLVFLSVSASGCPIPPPFGVTLPDWFYDLHNERPELYKLPKEAVERLQRQVENRELFQKGLVMPENAEVVGETSYTGTWKIPVVMGLFSNTTSVPFSRDTLQQEMFNGPWPTGTLKEFYSENSYGQFTFTGTVYDWVKVSQNDTYYEGGCNGLCGSARTGQFIKEILDQLDSVVDFRQFDNDGDGRVEALAVIHPEPDGSCGTKHIWAHQASLSSWLGHPYVTNDGVTIDDYIIQGSYCDGTITRIGVLAHELGHILGLPDLYDTDRSSNGLGRWELMASGSWNGLPKYKAGERPPHMCGWSKALLGWLTPQVITENQSSLPIQPFENNTGDLLKLSGPSSEEYFLLENRQPIGFDNALPGSGLLIYHVDDGAGHWPFWNDVNQLENCGSCVTGGHYRIALKQADGLCDLECDRNRGDAGDPFPGSLNNTTFNGSSNPNSLFYSSSKTCVAVNDISTSGSDIIADVLMVDPNDPNCQATAENCTNGIDDDGDGLIDCEDPDCCGEPNCLTAYSSGISSIIFKYTAGPTDSASLRMCVDGSFCKALKGGPEQIVLELSGCGQVTIPAGRLKPNFSRTKFSARSLSSEKPSYSLVIDCRGWLRLLLWNIDVKNCVSNPVRACVYIKDGSCYCAEEEFVPKLNRNGRLRSLSLSVTGHCPAPK